MCFKQILNEKGGNLYVKIIPETGCGWEKNPGLFFLPVFFYVIFDSFSEFLWKQL